ncbi:MAG: peptidoglycan-binding protein [Gammaproteobacteria bacterium]
MATQHTVKQGENLGKIAKQYKIGDWKDIYLHPSNADFRKKRPNPNIICPGDVIFIPEKKGQTVTVRTGSSHRFVVCRAYQELKLKLVDDNLNPLPNIKACYDLGQGEQTAATDRLGMLTIQVADPDLQTLSLKLYADEDPETPSHYYDVKLSYLDAADSLAGLQGRLNALGFDCGVVDGIYGKQTKAGISGYQKHKGMVVDGQASAAVYAAVAKDYGC